jgi:hypothetical protein
MTQDDLRARLAAKEDNFVERKSQGVSSADIRKTLSAFANSVPDGREAVLFIGVADVGEVQGCDNSDLVQKRVREALQDCYPPIVYASEVLTLDGMDVVAVRVEASKERPHFTGLAYVRIGSESVKATPQLFDEMVIARTSKVAAILRLRGRLITAFGIGHRLGQLERIAGDYRESGECEVIACDAHQVTLQRTSDNWRFYEAVSRIELSTDGRMKRPAFIVTGL